ncbi:MAG: amidohydrolase [Acidimicrobiales bacterium]|nr:amidohydrolase [Acidimicrobiales bacterium]
MEPPDLWSRVVDADIAVRAPRVEVDGDADWWVIDGRRMFSFSVATKAGLRFEGQDRLLVDYRFDEVRPGSHLPEEHLRDNAADGVWASVLYPSVATILYGYDDTALVQRLARVYNDWIAEWCSHDPTRLCGVAVLDVDDVDAAVAELERVRARGLRTALIPVSPPTERPYLDPAYDPLWAAAADLDMPLSLHIATNRPPDEWRTLWSQWGFQGADRFVRDSLAQMIFSGVFERHERLRVVSVEHEASWVPHFLARIDETYTQRTPREGWYRLSDDTLPSELFRRNVMTSIIEDRHAVMFRDEIGVDLLMWGSDYPHAESTFPRSVELLDEMFAGVPDSDRAAITSANAASLYGLEVPRVQPQRSGAP